MKIVDIENKSMLTIEEASRLYKIGEHDMGDVPIWKKYSLNIEEAASYYGIGIKKIYGLIHEHPNADFLLEIGSHYRIKRVLFEKFLDDMSTI